MSYSNPGNNSRAQALHSEARRPARTRLGTSKRSHTAPNTRMTSIGENIELDLDKEDEDDGDVDDGDAEKKPRKAGGGFQKPFNLSYPLAELCGEPQVRTETALPSRCCRNTPLPVTLYHVRCSN